MQSQNGELPSGYTRVQYLESSGTQYIDTGIYAEKDIYAKAGMMRTKKLIANGFILASYDYDSCRMYPFNMSSRRSDIKINSWCVGYGSYDWIGSYELNTYYDVVSDFKDGEQIITANGVKMIKRLTGGKQSNVSLGMFALHICDRWEQPCCAKVYYCTIIHSGSKVLDFIPSIDQSGRPCMYDTVTKQPFYNQGTGEFGYELMDGTYVAPI